MLNTTKRIESLEAGVVLADKKFSKAAEWSDLDTALNNIRERTGELYNRIAAVKRVLQTSKEICTEIQKELNGKA